MNYEVEQKRHWRYWVWKRIAENCGVHPRFATVLFLSGPSPSDLQAATKYGFKLRNIVAVDMNAECVEAARKSGCTAIQGSLHEVVTKWSDGTIHGVVADYCCGLTITTAIESYQIASVANACAFNFQRGRECDPQSRALREFYDCKDRSQLLKLIFVTLWHMMYHWDYVDKGRRPWLFSRMMSDAALPYCLGGEKVRTARAALFMSTFKLMQRDGIIAAEDIKEFLSASEFGKIPTYSYRSNKVVMDSMAGSFVCIPDDRKQWLSANKTILDRRLAAVKAIRTMNGAVKMHASSN